MESNMERLFFETKKYVDLKLDQFKLQMVSGLSQAISNAIVVVIVLFLFMMLLAIASYALINWLNGLLGGQFGSLIVGGVVLVAIIVVLSLRKKLFRDSFVKLFAEAFWYDED